jgi:hypothetical protein
MPGAGEGDLMPERTILGPDPELAASQGLNTPRPIVSVLGRISRGLPRLGEVTAPPIVRMPMPQRAALGTGRLVLDKADIGAIDDACRPRTSQPAAFGVMIGGENEADIS